MNVLKYCIGIDLGGTTAKIGLFKTLGKLICKWEVKTNRANNGCNIIPELAVSINNKLNEHKINPSEIKGIGIGVPGTVMEGGFVPISVNLGWRNISVTEEFYKLFKVPIKVDNDANVAALGEMWQGSGIGYRNLVMITLGTGVGGGVIINNKIISGLHGAAGEFGHIPIVYDEPTRCKCGRRGCLEQAASATGIVKYAARLLENNQEESLLRKEEELSAYKVFEAAKKGDFVALNVVERAGRFLGIALATISGALDPEVFIIGGGVSNAGEFFLDVIRKHYQENVFEACKDTKINLASLGNDAGIYGATKLVLVS